MTVKFSKCSFFLGHSIRVEAIFFMTLLPRVISSISSKSIVSEIYFLVILLIILAFDLYPRVVISLLLFPLIRSICSVHVITTLLLPSLSLLLPESFDIYSSDFLSSYILTRLYFHPNCLWITFVCHWFSNYCHFCVAFFICISIIGDSVFSSELRYFL